ncbi:TIGR04255 family protein [Shewanella sp. Isolate7]|uniref:TIGR04255 family protein n=1 Tax=Shewanella sp. Isolate7 TaxID=2908528 RepID=UPI001EFCD311|nr:TIGR04255 family protein [Shewanella sp. Isolate7]MCG9723388.1 TIGR04255 family protein [Shewanella sp. Isolate7]
MKKTLEKAPLVHVLIHLRFAEVPTLKTITPELLQTLHVRMIDEGFPEKIESQAELVELNFDSTSQQMKHRKLSKTRLLFRAAGEREIVEISESSIVLKSTDYGTFDDFYNKFHRLLVACMEIIPKLDKTLLKNVGLRYVDVIAPSGESTLCDYVSSEIQPPSLSGIGTHLQGHSLKAVKISENQILVVNFEELPTIDGRVQKVLPDNLMEPDDKCGLVIDGQKDWFKVKSTTYGILDIDHTYQFIQSPTFSEELIADATHRLYQSASDIFWDVISEHAKKAWGYKEER